MPTRRPRHHRRRAINHSRRLHSQRACYLPQEAIVITYLSTSEFAARIGVKRDTLNRYHLPEPDAMIGNIRGWLPETIDKWNASRPGRGHRWESAQRK